MYNKNYKKKLLTTMSWLCLLLPLTVLGHSPSQSSSMLVEDKNGQWTLQVRAALSAFEHVVNEAYTAEGYSSPEEFQDLMGAVLSKTLHLKIDGKEVVLGSPKIRLGHETVVVYPIDIPDGFRTVALENLAFKDIYNSKGIFMVLKSGAKRNLFTLDSSNDFTSLVKIENNEFVPQEKSKDLADISENGFFLLAFLLTILAFGLVVRLKPIGIAVRANEKQSKLPYRP